MRRKMIFRLGLTLVIFVGVLLYYMIKMEKHDDRVKDDIHSNVRVADTLEEPSVIEDKRESHLAAMDTDDKSQQANNNQVTSEWSGEIMHLSVVACGAPRVEETMVLLKSAILLSKRKLVFHVFAEDELHQSFKDQLSFWPEEFQKKFRFNIYSITFPAGHVSEWKRLFKPCASQRLFIPVLLKDVDSILYVDTDILFLRPVDDVWDHFHKFNSSQFAALAPEHEDEQTSWYKRFARHPYYGHLGVNSGVMLMNLTRMRKFDWLTHVLKYYQEYKMKITWGDQDVINIIFHYFPERLYVYGCDWNYRPDHCMYMSTCKLAEQAGISVLHGNRGVLHNDKQPTFKAIYDAFSQHHFGDSLQHSLLVKMKQNLGRTQVTNCGQVADIFIKQFEQQAIEWQKRRDEQWNLGQDTVKQV
ncbi:glucoside xylosyltransferase 1-like [Liolophura sinensis]|uniref:glucoside xylosyltransferase 1-like n=1 Tax=Liolophura sinensis TaxID=3198878 RepID=UPI0031597270